MENSLGKHETEMNLKDTELRLGLPGSDESEKHSSNYSFVRSNKRSSPETSEVESISKSNSNSNMNHSNVSSDDQDSVPPAK